MLMVASRASRYSPIVPVEPLLRVKVPERCWVFPSPSLVPVLVKPRLIDLMPRALRL